MNYKLNKIVILAKARAHIDSHKSSLKNIKADKLNSLVIEMVINPLSID